MPLDPYFSRDVPLRESKRTTESDAELKKLQEGDRLNVLKKLTDRKRNGEVLSLGEWRFWWINTHQQNIRSSFGTRKMSAYVSRNSPVRVLHGLSTTK